MSGGVFHWHKALLAQKNLWSKIPIPIKFYTTEVNATLILDAAIGEDLTANLSINDKINDMLDSFNEKDDDSEGENAFSNYLRQNRLKSYIQNNIKQSLFDHRSLKEEEESDNYYKNCDKGYKNVDLIGSILPFDIGCYEADKLIGQVLSWGFIIAPIIIMWVIVTLFYILYCCGCCCCCRAKDRYNPGIVSIVFFAIIAAFLIISLGFNIAASVNLFNIIKYVIDGEVFEDINYLLDNVKTPIQTIAKDFQGNLTSTINDASVLISDNFEKTSKLIDQKIDESILNLQGLSDEFSKIGNLEDNEIRVAQNSLDPLNKCAKTGNVNLCKAGVDNIVKFFKGIDFTEITTVADQAKDVSETVNTVRDAAKEANIIRDFKGKIVDFFDDAENKVDELNLQGKVDELNFSEYQNEVTKIEDQIPDKLKEYRYVLYTTCFIFPMFLVILTSLEIMAFWLKNCCSRCIVCYCCPRCICSCCLFFVGLICTFLAFGLIVIDIIYDQGDDIIDLFLKRLTNENRTIVFNQIDAASFTENMVQNIQIEDFVMGKPKMIKNFVDAKLGAKLTEFIAILDVFSFPQIGKMLNSTLTNTEINLTTIREMLKEVTSEIDKVDFNPDDLPMGAIKDQIDNGDDEKLNEVCGVEGIPDEQIDCIKKFSTTRNKYLAIVESLNIIVQSASNKITDTKEYVRNLPSEIADNLLMNMIKDLLSDVGALLVSLTNIIEPSVSGTDVNFAISAFNIIRVKFCREIFGSAMAFSISAHLFLVGYAAMTILLCCRRKGMGDVPIERAAPSFSYSEYSYSQDEPKEKKKKKKGRHSSDEENTSGNALVEFQDDGQPHSDAEKRDIDDSEKYSDDQSNYANPYQHDDSSISYQINDESTIQQSESFQPRVSENENESSVQNNELSFDEDESTNDNKANNIANIIKDIKDQQESESEPAKISETEDNDDTNEESSNYPNNNNINFHDDESSGNDSDIDDGDQQTYVF